MRLVRPDLPFPKPMLAGPDPLVVLCVLCDHTQDVLFHSLCQYQGQADKHVVLQIFLLTLLVGGHCISQLPVIRPP